MHTLMKLPYDYDALEPHIDAKTMEIHHTKHHQGYVDKLNVALERHSELFDLSVVDLITDLDNVRKDLVPPDIQTAVRNNGGGCVNHNLFFTLIGPDSGGTPQDTLANAIDATFGGFDEFKEQFTKTALARFGSGWAWLSLEEDGKLIVESTPNQDNPLMDGRTPILGLDLWEHAYYLKYQNRRADYISTWWNIVNWENVSHNYEAQVEEGLAI